jgi:predicted chitinase
MMDRKAFFDAIRKPLFGGTFEQSQVVGITRLLDVWEKFYAIDGNCEELAYDLATSYHETAATMQPIMERGPRKYFDKYETGTRLGKILGNTKPGDGYRFRGEGDVQNTGRANAAKATRRLNKLFGLNIDLEANPSLRSDPMISAHSLFLGNREGWWTGKALGRFIDGKDEADDVDVKEYLAARGVVNGSDKAQKIANHALVFETALRGAGYDGKSLVSDALPVTQSAPIPAPEPEPVKGMTGILKYLLAALAAMFKKGT